VRLDWDSIDTTLLDMDGTLLDLHYDNHFWLEHLPRRYAQIRDRAEDEVRHELVEHMRREQGKLHWYCLDYWSRELGLDVIELKREVKHLIAVRPYVEDFLAALQERGKRMLLVTNAHQTTLELKLDETGLERWFDAILSSHSFARPKEDPLFWAELQRVEDFDPARTLLIDDNHAVLDSARRFGIRHLLSLLQPDSRREPRGPGPFPAILHFDEVLPDLREHGLG
jgi:putative hydrolase of the HAD superfamily